jgi:membrane protease YdiL (CAAX protease family)
LVSTVLFALYHLYYGAYDAAVVGITGLIFACYYVARGRLLPLILAHGLYDTYETFYGFWYMQQNHGAWPH